MGRILFLTHRMSMGYGVSVVVDILSRKISAMGHTVCIGTMIADYQIEGVNIYTVDPDPTQIDEIARANSIDVIIAHTTPFFEVLPALRGKYKCIAYEHGDPSYQFFPDDGEERKRIAEYKQESVYPYIDGVIAISEFIRSDIKWNDAYVIHNGADHTPAKGEKSLFDIMANKDKPLRIGTLMRLGAGEALYKGNNLYISLCEELKKRNINAEYCVMGRGTEHDADNFKEKGYRVHLNASDEERDNYLRELDIFISPSLWEGFNLPIVEAMRSGTLGMVFDVGSHPEVCPFLFSNINEMVSQIEAYAVNRKLLCSDSVKCYRFVNNNFSWDSTVTKIINYLVAKGCFNVKDGCTSVVSVPAPVCTAAVTPGKSLWGKGLAYLKQHGVFKTCKKVVLYMSKK